MKTTYIDFKILLLSVFVISFITGFAQSGDDFCNIQQSELDDYENKNGNCNTNPYGDFIFYDDLDTYIPNFDSEPLHHPPLKTIKLNINIFQKDDGTGNYPDNQETRDGLNQIIQWVNGIYNVCDPCDPISGVQEIESTNIQFSIGEEGSERIYFYQNGLIWNSSSSTTLLNEVLSEDPERSNCINVLISGSTGSYAYASMPVYTDLGKNQWVFLFYWGEEIILYAKANQLAHELGHNLAQLHTYLGGGASANCNNNDEYLSDIFGTWPGNCPHIGPPNIWGEDACEFPDDQKTNNLMGGNMANCYISPKQAGQMHRTLAVTSARRFVEKVKSDIPLVIDSDETWDFDIRLYRDIIIEPGSQLTISCKVNMPYDGKIIVKQNAKLIVNGGIITTMDDEFWAGIEVWGNSDQHQYEYSSGNRYQGMVTLKNNATIENAYDAIMLWKPGDWHSMGGIIQATDAFFYNNRRSVAFMSYQNFHPILGDEYPMANLSYFRDCHFEVNDDYINESDFNAHISMWDVNGISIRSSNFINEMTNGIHTGHGIYTASAGYSVLSKCNSQMSPCPEPYLVRSVFEGFEVGVGASNLETIYTILIKEAEFNNNTYGVQLSTVNNAAIIKSNFEIGYNDQDECEGEGEKSSGYGIYLDNCSGFAIEENEFTKYPGASGDYTGIFISSTKASDEIYKNTFEGLSYGNYTSGQNWKSGYIYEGLTFFCNENQSNYADFYVEQDPVNPSGIQSKQGDDELVTGNKFSTSGATWHFYNGGDHLVGYYYCDYCGNENPDDDKIYNVTDKGKSFDNPCPSHYGGGSGRELVLSPEQKQEAEQEYASSLNDYNNVKALYENLKDGGNTEATISDVETSWPQDMWELRTELLGKSPHLSIDVLKKAADKTDVMPESVLFEILAANPDELKKEELIKYLEDKENPLPEYMIDILRQVAGGTTYKTVLEQQMGRYNQAITRSAYDIIRSNLNDSITDYNELRNWLDNIGGARADEQIIVSYIQENNFEDALILANMMPDLYGYNSNELTEHSYYLDLLNLQYSLANEGRSIFQLNTTEINDLVLIAENSYGIAAAQAKGILEFAYGYEYCNCLQSSDNLSLKSSGNVNYDALNQVYGAEIIVSPNPADQWTAFNYTLPDNETEGIVKISDISGKLIETFIIKGQQGQKIWDTRKINQGVYFYTFIVNGISKSGKIVIGK